MVAPSHSHIDSIVLSALQTIPSSDIPKYTPTPSDAPVLQNFVDSLAKGKVTILESSSPMATRKPNANTHTILSNALQMVSSGNKADDLIKVLPQAEDIGVLRALIDDLNAGSVRIREISK